MYTLRNRQRHRPTADGRIRINTNAIKFGRGNKFSTSLVCASAPTETPIPEIRESATRIDRFSETNGTLLSSNTPCTFSNIAGFFGSIRINQGIRLGTLANTIRRIDHQVLVISSTSYVQYAQVTQTITFTSPFEGTPVVFLSNLTPGAGASLWVRFLVHSVSTTGVSVCFFNLAAATYTGTLTIGVRAVYTTV